MQRSGEEEEKQRGTSMQGGAASPGRRSSASCHPSRAHSPARKRQGSKPPGPWDSFWEGHRVFLTLQSCQQDIPLSQEQALNCGIPWELLSPLHYYHGERKKEKDIIAAINH